MSNSVLTPGDNCRASAEVSAQLSVLTVIVAPLAFAASLGDSQEAANGVGGAQRVRVRRLRWGDSRTGNLEKANVGV